MPPARPDRSSPSFRPGTPQLVEVGASSLRERLVARDEQALAELIEIVTPWLLGLVQGLLSDADEAEEVAQDVFAVVWNRIGQMPDDPRGLVAWVLRIARNRAIDRLRSRQRRRRKAARLREHGLDDEPFAAAPEPNEAGTPGWHVHQTVHAALAALPHEQGVVIRLAYFQGLTHSEIAARLGIPIGTVKTRLRLAVDRLRLALAPMKDWIV
ncbi:MAG TPA: sigma-70 family RNA polymerase sigma factor [Gemmatimonadales bacterium]|nr:sigma-70 family RNA polymerase sigma factor [Gemmatimonadales bacterium]